ncbi:MAG: zf-HC2 domain-containing protein [Clostridiaceae bacterium]|nr:zf-HC2 domain-containing protein [Clostridiaceae bacterium]
MKCEKDLLYDFVDNLLDEEKANEIKKHIQACSDCRMEDEEIRRYKEAMKSLGELNAPADFTVNVLKKVKEINNKKVISIYKLKPVVALCACICLIIALANPVQKFLLGNKDNKAIMESSNNQMLSRSEDKRYKAESQKESIYVDGADITNEIENNENNDINDEIQSQALNDINRLDESVNAQAKESTLQQSSTSQAAEETDVSQIPQGEEPQQSSETDKTTEENLDDGENIVTFFGVVDGGGPLNQGGPKQIAPKIGIAQDNEGQKDVVLFQQQEETLNDNDQEQTQNENDKSVTFAKPRYVAKKAIVTISKNDLLNEDLSYLQSLKYEELISYLDEKQIPYEVDFADTDITQKISQLDVLIASQTNQEIIESLKMEKEKLLNEVLVEINIRDE